MSNNSIGTLQESSLHNSLKYYFANPEDKIESKFDGYVIDIIKPDELVEIQTNNFSSIKQKLKFLIKSKKVRLIYPIPQKKWIVKKYKSGKIERRKSPKKGNLLEVYRELIRIPKLLQDKNFSLELVLIHEEEYRVDDGKGSWRRRGWSITNHKLLKIVDTKSINSPKDLISLFPKDLPQEFTNKDLKEIMSISKYIAQKATYCLRKMGMISLIGKKNRYNLYSTNK